MESTNVNDLVGFCPHEDLSGQGNADKFCGFMVPGQFKMNFAGKRLTIEGAKITAGEAKKVVAKKIVAAKPMHAQVQVDETAVEQAEPATPAEEAVVKVEVDPVADTPVEAVTIGIIKDPVADTPVEVAPDAPVAEAPVKKRRSRKKA